MAEIEKEIHEKYFLQIYYFTNHFVNDQEKTLDIVASSFIQLFDSPIPDNDIDIEDFLYATAQIECEDYFTGTLEVSAPSMNDFLNTRLDAEFLMMLYNIKKKKSI